MPQPNRLNFKSRQIIWSCYYLNLFFISFAIILPYLCQNCVYSWYFFDDEEHKLIQKASLLNEIRRVKAESYFSIINNTETLLFHTHNLNQSGLVLQIVVVAINRKSTDKLIKVGYLSQVMAQFDVELKAENNSKIAILICNCDQKPEKFDESKYMSHFFSVIMKSHNHSLPLNLKTHSNLNQFEINKRDYTFCLLEALVRNPKYILIVEDDAIPQKNFFSILFHILATKIEYKFSQGEMVKNSEKWAILKLYYPEKWSGYSNEVHDFMELLSLSVLGGLLNYLFHYYLLKCIKIQYPIVNFIMGSIYTLFIVYTIGKQNILQLIYFSKHFYYIKKAPGCCTPANLYSTNIVSNAITYLSSINCSSDFPMDLALDKFVEINNLTNYLVVPNLFKHIGMYSTRTTGPKKAVDFLFL